MRTIKLVRPDNFINGGISCQDCHIPMPAEKDAAIMEIDWGNIITLPIGWTEKHTRHTTALDQGVRRVESKVYYCPACGTKYIRESLPPLPEPTLQKVDEAFREYRNPNNDAEPPSTKPSSNDS